jgi:hypothetical protein
MLSDLEPWRRGNRWNQEGEKPEEGLDPSFSVTFQAAGDIFLMGRLRTKIPTKRRRVRIVVIE